MAFPRHTSHYFVLFAIIAALLLCFFPPSGLDPNQSRTLAIALVTLVLWATAALPNFLVALLFFTAAILLKVAPPSTVFSGFSSTAMWLLFSGTVIGMAIRSTGLGDRMALFLEHRLGGGYATLVGGIMVSSMLLGFLMPSSIGRAVMMVPIAMALADRVGLAPGSQGRTGMALAAALGSHMSSFAILPSNVPNMILSGAAESFHGVQIGYLNYLLLHYPLLGLVKSAIITLLILRLFPAGRLVAAAAIPEGRPGGERRRQWQLAMLLVVALALWLTDSLHGINPAWVGLALACILLLPRIGLVDPAAFSKQMDVSMLLFVAGALGVGAVVNEAGLGAVIARGVESLLPLSRGGDLLNFFSLSVLSFVTGIMATLPGVPTILTPLAGELATRTGLDIGTVLMTQVIGFSTVLFPYQSPPLIVAMQLAKEPAQKLLRITVPLTAITFFVLLPLDYLWWVALGMLG